MSLSMRKLVSAGALALGVGLAKIYYESHPDKHQAITDAISSTSASVKAFLLSSSPGDAGKCVPREKIAHRRLNDPDHPYVMIDNIHDLHEACDPIKMCSKGGDYVSCSGEDKRIVCVDPNSISKANLSDTDWTCSNIFSWWFSVKVMALTTQGRRKSGDSNTTCYVSPLLCVENQK